MEGIQFRTTKAARDGVVRMIARDIQNSAIKCQFNENSPDGDIAKFTINGKVARAIHVFNGYHLPIRKEWFTGEEALPRIKGNEFYYYVFAIEPRPSRGVIEPHYLITDYLTIRNWVLEFDAPFGRDFQNKNHWMANIQPFNDGTAYFRWGDEPLHANSHRASRLRQLDNVRELLAFNDSEDNQHESELQSRNDIPETEKSQLIRARRGQGVFRTQVSLIETKCRITGVSSLEHLRASHIKPWRLSSSQEKLDGNNGLLLSPHVDHLFDHGYISFRANGSLLVSHQITGGILAAWNIAPNLNVGGFLPGQEIYLQFHRDNVFKP